jgi:hypothetical protein
MSAFEGRILKYSLLGGGVGVCGVVAKPEIIYSILYGGLYKI